VSMAVVLVVLLLWIEAAVVVEGKVKARPRGRDFGGVRGVEATVSSVKGAGIEPTRDSGVRGIDVDMPSCVYAVELLVDSFDGLPLPYTVHDAGDRLKLCCAGDNDVNEDDEDDEASLE
jgi:hypothetical protein